MTITFTTSPVENDVIFVFPGVDQPERSRSPATSPPTDWAFAFPTGNVHGGAGGAACGLGAIYHVVTAAEDTANTVTWTLTNLFAATEIGAATACYVRGVDPDAVIDLTAPPYMSRLTRHTTWLLSTVPESSTPRD